MRRFGVQILADARIWPGDEMEAITDLSSVGPQVHAGSNPARATGNKHGEAAQMADGRRTVNPVRRHAAGSNPAFPTILEGSHSGLVRRS